MTARLNIAALFIILQVETQKIISQKEYFERSIAELDQDLRDAVEAADTTERDAK